MEDEMRCSLVLSLVLSVVTLAGCSKAEAPAPVALPVEVAPAPPPPTPAEIFDGLTVTSSPSYQTFGEFERAWNGLPELDQSPERRAKIAKSRLGYYVSSPLGYLEQIPLELKLVDAETQAAAKRDIWLGYYKKCYPGTNSCQSHSADGRTAVWKEIKEKVGSIDEAWPDKLELLKAFQQHSDYGYGSVTALRVALELKVPREQLVEHFVVKVDDLSYATCEWRDEYYRLARANGIPVDGEIERCLRLYGDERNFKRAITFARNAGLGQSIVDSLEDDAYKEAMRKGDYQIAVIGGKKAYIVEVKDFTPK